MNYLETCIIENFSRRILSKVIQLIQTFLAFIVVDSVAHDIALDINRSTLVDFIDYYLL